jgi:hypothetical protein
MESGRVIVELDGLQDLLLRVREKLDELSETRDHDIIRANLRVIDALLFIEDAKRRRIRAS